MKQAISLLLALALALSLGLIRGMPAVVGAAGDTLYVFPMELSATEGQATAAWSQDHAQTGSYSVHLETTGTVGSGHRATVRVEMPSGTTLGDITSVSWQRYLVAGYVPYLDIKLEGGITLTVEGAYANSDNTLGFPTGIWASMFDGGDGGYPAWATWLTGNVADTTQLSDDMAVWRSGIGGVGGTGADGPNLQKLSTYRAGWNGISDASVVVALEIEVDNRMHQTEAYVDAIEIDGTIYYGLIQDAIDAATGTNIEVAAGTYVEDLVIPAGKDGLQLKGAGKATTKINGVAFGGWGDWPNHAVATGIECLSNEVKIHGFTIETPDVVAGYAFSIVLTGTGVEIFDNHFVGTGDDDSYSVAIQTFSVDAMATSDITGLQIYDNTFTGAGDLWVYQGVLINRDSADGLVTISSNTFTGNIHTGIANEGSNAVISGNEITSEFAGHGITVRDRDGRQQENVEITGNTVEGFSVGILIGQVGQVLADITVTENTIEASGTGVRVDSSAGGVLIKLNDIVGNTDWGVLNTGTATLNARYNWWGHQTGPDHDGLNRGGQGDAVSDDVDVGPWLYKPREQFVSGAPCYAGSVLLANEATPVTVNNVTSYEGGWNSFSTPIALDSSANTVSKLLALTTGSGLFIERAQRFDLATQGWVAIIMGNQLVGPDYTIRPGEGFFIQVRSAGSIPVLVRTDATVPPSRDLVAGWNLIGLSSLQAQTVTTAVSGVDYSFVFSPRPPNAEGWIVPPDGAGDKFLEVGEAYWVAMGQSGILFGSTTTPVADDMIWDLNR